MSGLCVAPSGPSCILSKAGAGGLPKTFENQENMVDVYQMGKGRVIGARFERLLLTANVIMFATRMLNAVGMVLAGAVYKAAIFTVKFPKLYHHSAPSFHVGVLLHKEIRTRRTLNDVCGGQTIQPP